MLVVRHALCGNWKLSSKLLRTYRHDHLRAHHDAKTQKHGTEVEFGDLAPPAELKISEHILVNFVCVVIGSVLHGVLSALMCVPSLHVSNPMTHLKPNDTSPTKCSKCTHCDRIPNCACV